VAEQVMRMPDSSVAGISKGNAEIQRKCAECASGQGTCSKCAEVDGVIQRKPIASTITPLVQRQSKEPEEEEEETLHRKETSSETSEAASDLEAQINGVKGGGQPLPESVRNYFEPRFGHDFSQVRIHTDARAAASARGEHAHAYTVGQHVVFDAGAYSPATPSGQRFLAHELTHTIQQTRNPGISASMVQRQVCKRTQMNAGRHSSSNSTESSTANLRKAFLELYAAPAKQPLGPLREASKVTAGQLHGPWRAVCAKRPDMPPQIMWVLDEYIHKEPKKEAAKKEPASAPPTAEPKKECAAPHPVKLHTIGHLIGSLNFGFVTVHTWKSSTGTLEDLKKCMMSEYITYSKIPNPPYGTEDGKPVPESGRSERIGDHGVTPERGKTGTGLHQNGSENPVKRRLIHSHSNL
jgi:hypothetical protein